MRISTIFSSAMLILLASACTGPDTPGKAYEALQQAEKKGKTGDAIGTSGDLEVTKGDLAYALSYERVLRYDNVKELTPGARNLVVKKAVLRELAIHKGLEEGLFDSPDARKYILPRMEKLLEEYYFYKKANYEKILSDVRKLDPGDEVLKARIEEVRGDSGRQLDLRQMQAEKEKVLRLLVAKRMNEERNKLIEELIKSSPPIKVNDTSSGAPVTPGR